ncbi:hypothetical protein QE152_g33023 [Popillia japonica]|uniref:DNA-directed DNA polymerase n=1 Tax=Popillia japonica TaxID=7064 RepID=A0AAW1IYU0_POPJA
MIAKDLSNRRFNHPILENITQKNSNQDNLKEDQQQAVGMDFFGLQAVLSILPPNLDEKSKNRRPERLPLENITRTNSAIGYVLEVDLHFPKELHDKFNDLPLAPENKPPPNSKVNKLICDFHDKKNYIVHYKTLKLYKDLGMEITKVHRGIEFEQVDFIKPYVEFCTVQRQKATNEFEVGFWKLMVNANFGKSMESVRKRQDLKLYSNELKAQRAINKPTFRKCVIYGENLVFIHKYKTTVSFNKPVYLGQAILDLSKAYMYDFHYNVIKREYNEKVKLMYMDTDSLIYHFKEDFNIFIKNNQDLFDTSNYPKDHELYNDKNKKVIGK